MTNKQNLNNTIALNRRATHDYIIEERFEAGIVLEGWEVKSLRAHKTQLDQGYIIIKNNALWLLGALITPLATVSTHFIPDPVRTRKLLLHQKEINKLIGHVERKGYTLIPLTIYWKENYIKVQVGLAKGKKLYDKRTAAKERDWQREKERVHKTFKKAR